MKLGLTIMSVIAMAVTAASCGNDDRSLLSTVDPAAQTTTSPAQHSMAALPAQQPEQQ